MNLIFKLEFNNQILSKFEFNNQVLSKLEFDNKDFKKFEFDKVLSKLEFVLNKFHYDVSNDCVS